MTRATGELRGRLVRAVLALAYPEPSAVAGPRHAGALFNTLADIGKFNRMYPELAIPSPHRVLGGNASACPVCHGDGATDSIPETLTPCASCAGSGFAGIVGYSWAAQPTVVVAPPTLA